MITDPPPADNVCKLCGGEVIQRDDDKEETVRNRLVVYHEKTAPLKSYYEKQGKLKSVDASQQVEKVRAELVDIYENLR
jgi:adenylate kinase